ncbi:MAG: prohibitin family protein [Chlorobi bacterium]|nr:prohibitin family protein [Chlorobiota bacterium]
MKTIKNISIFNLAIGIAIIFIVNGCAAIIKPGYNGVINRPLGRGLKTEKVYADGLAWKMPWNNMMKYNVQLKSYQEEISILTSDELHTTLSVSVILKPKQDELPSLILEIGRNYYQSIVKPEFISVTRSILAKYIYSELSAKSTEIETEIFENLKNELSGKHIDIDRVTLDHIMYSPVVTQATDVKLATKQQIEQKSFEMEIAEKEAEIQRIKARGQRDAQQIIDEGLTVKYLQFKALEVQDKLSKSPNSTFYFIPLGKDGLPVIVDTGK